LEINMAKISVVVPIYNAEKTLKRCVDSILAQSFSDLEIILVDDGSNDSSGLIADNYAQKDNRVKVIHQKNGGVCKARNVGIDNASSEWITFVESDDYLPDNACMDLYHEVGSECDFVMGAYYKVGEDGCSIKHLFQEEYIFFDTNDVIEVLLKKILGLTGEQLKFPAQIDTLLTCSSKLYKRDIIINNRIKWIDRKVIYSDCLDFLLNYTLHCKSAVYIDKPLYYYVRNNTESQTASFRPRTIELWDYQFKEIERFIIENNLNETLSEAFTTRVCFSVIPIGGNAYRMKNYKKALQEIRRMFNIPIYKQQFNTFKFKYLPFHWKVFFFFAKYRLIIPFYINTVLMRKLMNRTRKL